MNVCDSLRLALRNAHVNKIPTILSKVIKQGFTDSEFLHEYAQIVNTKINEYTFPQLTSILKSFSIPPYKNFKFFSQLCERILHETKTPEFNPSSKEITDFITSCGRLYYSDKNLIIQLSQHIAPNVESYRPKDLANIYHSLSKLRIHNDQLFKLISNVIIPYLYELTPICLVNLLVSYARTNMNDMEVVYPVISELNSRLDEMTPMDLLRMTMALSCIKIEDLSKIEIFIDNLLKRMYDSCWPLGYIQHLVLLESLIRLKAFDSKLVYGKILPSLLAKRPMVEKTLSFSDNVRSIECIACLPSVNETSMRLLELSIKRIPKVISPDGNLIARLLAAMNKLNYESKEVEDSIVDLSTPKFLELMDENTRKLIQNIINKIKNSTFINDNS